VFSTQCEIPRRLRLLGMTCKRGYHTDSHGERVDRCWRFSARQSTGPGEGSLAYPSQLLGSWVEGDHSCGVISSHSRGRAGGRDPSPVRRRPEKSPSPDTLSPRERAMCAIRHPPSPGENRGKHQYQEVRSAGFRCIPPSACCLLLAAYCWLPRLWPGPRNWPVRTCVARNCP
jgi:hypothetical protein